MRIAHFGSALALAVGLLSGPAFAGGSATGDYIEARSCSVYIGACHYSGEYVTAGREALMAWHFTGGSQGTASLAGLSAAAVVSADQNLAEPKASRHTVLYVDAKATPAQREALVQALKSRYGSAFGDLVAVRTAPIEFTKTATDYSVKIGNDARLTVQKDADHSCCQQPMQTWYKPLVPVTDSNVGFATLNEFKGTGLPTTWSLPNQNSSFYGGFAF
jgi:hypothetical protein